MKRLVILSILVAPLAIFVGVAFGVNWIVGCQQSHINNDDMILFPNQPGLSHQHVYVGARSNNAFSTIQSMQASGTTCGTPGDTAGYWRPQWVAGYPVHPNKGWLVYYAFGSNAVAFPQGLKMIVRWSSGRVVYKCGPGSATETRSPPTSCGSGMLVPVITFPRFWNGRDLDSPDHISHMSYSRSAAYPVEVPQIKVYARTLVPAGQPIDLRLSSGDYTTDHMDFVNAWKVGELERLMNQCRNTNCGTNPQ